MYVAIAAALLAIAAAAAGVYAFWLEPRRLVVNRHEIRSPFIPEGFDGRTILQFSDTHVGHYFPLERLARLVDTINALKPDIVVFTGDLYNAHNKRTEGDSAASPVLTRIEAPLGKFAVFGNHDFGLQRAVRRSGPLLTAGGFDMLVNETRRVAEPGGDSIVIAGLDDWLYGKPNPQRALSRLDKRDFNVLLLHEPDPADSLSAFPIDLQLSGHSHNGQVNLPVVGALVTTPLGKRYLSGFYAIAAGARRSRPYRLYVNNGVGTTSLPVRVGSTPEIAVFTLRREEREETPR